MTPSSLPTRWPSAATLPTFAVDRSLSSRSVERCRLTENAPLIIPGAKRGTPVDLSPKRKPRKRPAKDVSVAREARDYAAILTDGDTRKAAQARAKMIARRTALAA